MQTQSVENDGVIPGLILAIETASTNCSLAVYKGSELLAEHTLYVRNKHDEFLAHNSKMLLEQCGYDTEHVDAVAVSAGPGSFTGLRIGAAFAKGLCFGTSTRLLPVATLASVAKAATYCLHPIHETIMVVIPSHRDLAYMQRFDTNGIELEEGKLTTIEDVKDLVSESVFVCGPGAPLVVENTELLIPGLNRLTARFVGLLGSQLLTQNQVIDATAFIPSYMQEFEVRTS